MKKQMLSILIASAVAAPVAFADTEISGLIEVEAGFVDNDDGNTSDISLATVELGLDQTVSDKLDGHLLLLYEEGENDDNIAVDEATVNFHPREGLDVSVGRMYVPFGRFDSNMVSDPLTLELAETQEEAAQVGFGAGNVSGSAYVFKDDEDASDKIDDFGVNVDYETDNFAAGLSYISDVNDKSTADTEAAGIGVHASANFNKVTLIAEHIQMDEIDGGAEPTASNVEVGFDLGADRMIAATYQQTEDAAGLDLPETATGVAFSMPLYKAAGFAAEYMKKEAYDGTEENAVTLQVAYEF